MSPAIIKFNLIFCFNLINQNALDVTVEYLGQTKNVFFLVIVEH